MSLGGYGSAIKSSDFSTFSDEEKLNYALKIALSRVQTDLKAKWFNEPSDFAPKGPNEIFKQKIPDYNLLKDYFIIDPNADGNGIPHVTNFTVQQLLKNKNEAKYTLEEILDTTKVRENTVTAYNNAEVFEGRLLLLSRGMFTRYKYWENGLTGKNSPNSNFDSVNGTTESGTKSDKTEPFNALITWGPSGSLNNNRVWTNINDQKNNPDNNLTKFQNKLIEYAVPLEIIAPENYNKDDPTDISKKHPFLKVYLNVPTYTTKTPAFTYGISSGSDNLGFHNPVLSNSLGNVNGYDYYISGWDSSSWQKLQTSTYGAPGNQNILYFLNYPGFLLAYGLADPINGFSTSQQYPPMMSFVRYEGETFEDGTITQAPAAELPPPAVANDKQLFIDTTNDIIYRFDGVLNEWKSIGGGGGGGGGGDTSNLAKLDVSNTFLDDQLVKGKITAEGGFINLSDKRVKSNIETIDSAISKLMQLRGVYYDMRGMRHLGLIAQELKDIIPEAVSEMNNGYYGVEYGNLVGLLIEAFKEQEERLREVERKLGEVREISEKGK